MYLVIITHTHKMQSTTSKIVGIVNYIGVPIRVLHVDDVPMVVLKDVVKVLNLWKLNADIPECVKVEAHGKEYIVISVVNAIVIMSTVLNERACELFSKQLLSTGSPAKRVCKLTFRGMTVDVLANETSVYVPKSVDKTASREKVLVDDGGKLNVCKVINAVNVTNKKYIDRLKPYVDIAVNAWRSGKLEAKSAEPGGFMITKYKQSLIAMILFTRDTKYEFIDFASVIDIAEAVEKGVPEFTGEFITHDGTITPVMTLDDFKGWLANVDAMYLTKFTEELQSNGINV